MTKADTAFSHDPVLINEVISALQPRDGGAYVDGTLGVGGYTRAILDAADCSVWAIDRDPDTIRNAEVMAEEYSGRLTVVEGRFGDMVRILKEDGVSTVDGIALDLGVSSMQLDDPCRGFSFRHSGPLDMRQEKDGPSASDLINEAEESFLADIIYKYGEERRARRIARAIVAARTEAPLTNTLQLADIVRNSYGHRRDMKIDPATKTFQAIRIHVNDELGELSRGLGAAEILLAPGGRLAVVSFHSIESRITKEFVRSRAGNQPVGSRHLPLVDIGCDEPTFRPVHRGVIEPTEKEKQRNPRSRSARLRVAERTNAPVTVETERG
ncbi:MAG: Ribosomal RNA small subunit methyltransferase H [Alphaproteobacteria bacterium MarineAlpha11_Bin1]|nr:MAG: Ribosomal RNA small subunit methyltransferase H [Alphaproteobacteria bacterium MarineAlpha11_Bin1]|tara:strand:+ start:12595 stop:13572 length:978 start_codon:yes stop_codon:yes gene_type:complete